MPLRILTTAQAPEWKQVLLRAQRYDFYHLPQYHALAEHQGEGQARLFVYEEGDRAVALPLLLRSLPAEPWGCPSQTEWKDATSVYGYPGPVASHQNLPTSFLENFHQALLQGLQEQKVIAVFSRFNPLLEQRFLVAGLGECRALGQTVSLDLTTTVEDQLAGYHRTHRRAVNFLRRNGYVGHLDEQREHLDDFAAIYHETMLRVGAQSCYFFGRPFFEELLKDSDHQVHLYVVRKENQVACAALFLESCGILQYHLSGTATEFLPRAPMKLLLDDVSRWARTRGLQVMHLGGGLGAGQDSLFHFKAAFSNRRHDFAIWRWVLRPDLYQDLCQMRHQWAARQSMQGSEDYFPAYRAPLSPVAVA